MSKNYDQINKPVYDMKQALAQAEQMLEGSSDVKVLLAQQLVQQKKNEDRLDELEALVRKPKDNLTLEEAADFLGFRKSYLYKMVYERKIPCYKPFGKLIYFERSELEALMKTNRIATVEEIKARANTYILDNPINR